MLVSHCGKNRQLQLGRYLNFRACSQRLDQFEALIWIEVEGQEGRGS